MPAAPQFITNLYHTKFKPPQNAPEGSEFNCAICLVDYTDEDDIIPLPCDDRHFFHAACITSWLESNNSCPLCKAPITQEALAKQMEKINQQQTQLQKPPIM